MLLRPMDFHFSRSKTKELLKIRERNTVGQSVHSELVDSYWPNPVNGLSQLLREKLD